MALNLVKPGQPHSSPGVVASALARNRLGAVAVCFMMLSAAAPFTVVAGVITLNYGVSGVTAIPVAFVVVGVVLAVFAVGHLAMARHIVNAGAFYAYVARGLGRPAGVAAALVALVAYNALQLALYGAFGVTASAVVEAMIGWQLPWWLLAVGLWALVAALGVRRVDLNGRLLAVLMCGEVAIITLFDVAFLAHPANGVLSFATLDPGGLATHGATAVLITAVLGYIGFEQATVYSEEARDRVKTTARATYACIAVIAVLYTFSAWAMSVAVGLDQIASRAAAEQQNLLFSLAGQHLGTAVADVGSVLFVTSIAAAAISFHNAVARYAYALGRENVLPRLFGRTSRRHGSPKYASLTQTALGITYITTYAVAGWDPMVAGFYWGGMFGGLGCLFLYLAAAVAIISFFGRHPTLSGNRWVTVVCPSLAAVALLAVATAATLNLDTLLGVPTGHPATTWMPATYAIAAGVGVVWALVLRRVRTRAYERIGLGSHAATATTANHPHQ